MAEASAPPQQKRHLKERAIDEFRRFIVIFLYLWVVFGLLSIHKSFVLAQRHLDYTENAFAIVNAFVFAKVLLIAEDLRLGKGFDRRPLLYPILYKSFIFSVVLICFHIAENILVGVWHGSTIANSFALMFAAGLKDVLSMGMMCFIVLLPFFGFREIARVIGHREMRALLLEREGNDPTPPRLGRQ
jgi:hypothetical protein